MSSSSRPVLRLVIVLVGRLVSSLVDPLSGVAPSSPCCVCMVFVVGIGCVMCYMSGSLPEG